MNVLRFFKYLFSLPVKILESLLLTNQYLGEIVYQSRLQRHDNPFARNYSQRYTSQSDEDGLTLEICRRIGILRHGTFLEIGVGDGSENNTLILLMHGWRGAWIGCETLRYPPYKSLSFINAWVTRDNAPTLYQDSLVSIGAANEYDLWSIDTDGNDIYFLEALLRTCKIQPKVIICEYNAAIPPTVSWSMPYNPNFNWKATKKRDAYFGASLLAFVELLGRYDFTLVACNPHTGVNAFFVSNEYADLFEDAERDISRIYASPFYRYSNRFGYQFSHALIDSLV